MAYEYYKINVGLVGLSEVQYIFTVKHKFTDFYLSSHFR